MIAVFKYSLEVEDEQQVKIPGGDEAELLHVGMQNGVICIWARVNDQAPGRQVTFLVRGTGHPIPDSTVEFGLHTFYKYRGTVDYCGDGRLIYHVFSKETEILS